MSGKMVRNQGASEPAAIAFLVIIGLMISAAIGAVVVLWKAHLLSAHTPWARVPGALWSMRHLPIVWKPFLAGFFIAFAVCLIGIVSSLFTGQKLHGEARWARIGEVRKAKLLEDAGILLGRINGKFMRFGGTEHVLLEAPTRAGKGVGVVIPNLLQWPDSVVVLDVKQENWAATVRIPTKPAGDSDLKPAVVPRRSRPPFRSEAGRWRRRSRGSEVKITGSVQQVKR